MVNQFHVKKMAYMLIRFSKIENIIAAILSHFYKSYYDDYRNKFKNFGITP